MFWDKSGRKERRLPILVAVNLASVSPVSSEEPERTFTDNISAHGARVHSATCRQLGEQVEISPLKGEQPTRGEVVYCQKLGENRFFIGLKFRSQIPWSVLQRFNGPLLMAVLCATCPF